LYQFFKNDIGKEGKMKKLSIALMGLLFLFGWFDSGKQIGAAEHYPVKPITFIVPLEAGSDGDVLARPLCQKVSTLLGQPIVIVNKPGAGSSIGYRELYGTRPDGYTIGWGSATIIAVKLQGIFPYDHEDFTVMGTYATYIPIIVGSTKTQRPFKTIAEVLSFAKSHPGEVTIATSGVGQVWWIATMAFQAETGLKFNIIPQPGAGGFAVAQVAGGHTDLAILGLGAAKPQVAAGNVQFLAVFGSKKAAGYEHVPTLKETGYDVQLESTQVIMGPPKMPKDVTDKLVEAFRVAANDPEYQRFVMERNAVPYYMPPGQAVNFFNEQRKVYRTILTNAGILKEKQ